MMTGEAIVREILELARWAPSGDNTQPWRFQIVSARHVVVHGFDTRDHCVYDLDGHPSQISLGALLETIALAATRFGMRAEASRRRDDRQGRTVFDVQFSEERGLDEDRLVPFILQRRVQRRPLSTRQLTCGEKLELQRAIGADFRLRWFEGWSHRLKVAWLTFRSAKIRLTLPEAYRVHREVIEWNALQSEDRIPDAAVGASALSLVLMRWAMKSWERVDFMNRYFAGTLLPRVELELVPGVACAAHCAMLSSEPPGGVDAYVCVGRALQRFWLTATRLGLRYQPEYTPLVFARYARQAVAFTKTAVGQRQAQAIRSALEELLGPDDAPRTVFMGRIGAGPEAHARSTRLPLERLLLTSPLEQT